jgi:hypothetical protein
MYALPKEIASWLTKVFAAANEAASTELTRVPNAHEEHLDMTLISSLRQFAAPFVFPSDWMVKIDTHFLGGTGGPWGKWEIADIGLLVMFRQQGKLLRTKVGLLQSKRLYAKELKSKDEHDYVGFGRLFEKDDAFVTATRPRIFEFSESSKYLALEVDGEQYVRMRDYEGVSDVPIYYLFYNPLQIPFAARLPWEAHKELNLGCQVGCRVLPAFDFRENIADTLDTLVPRFADVCRFETGQFAEVDNKGGWRFEHFVVDRLLGCHTGYKPPGREDKTLARLFGDRSAPIQAAISVTIDAPAGTPETE